MPIEKDGIAAGPVALAGDAALIGIRDILGIRVGQMGRTPDIAFIVALVSGLADNIPPVAVLVVGEIYRLGPAGTLG